MKTDKQIITYLSFKGVGKDIYEDVLDLSPEMKEGAWYSVFDIAGLDTDWLDK